MPARPRSASALARLVLVSPLAVAVIVTLATCGEPRASVDAGLGAADVNTVPDTGPSIDAGSWRPRFAPRFIVRNPDVRCEPHPEYTFTPPDRPEVPRGTVRWVYRPARDPAADDRFRTLGVRDFIAQATPMVGTPTGGAIFAFGEQYHQFAVTPDGQFDFIARGHRNARTPTWMGDPPSVLVDSSLTRTFPELTIENATTSEALIPVDRQRLPGSTTDLAQAFVGRARPALLADGAIVWAPTDRTIMSSCRDGRTRWVLEYDPQILSARSGMAFYAPADRSIIAFVGPMYRLDYDGNVLAAREEPISGGLANYTETCGLAFTMFERGGAGQHAAGLAYVRGEDFSDERRLLASGVARPTADCGAWSYGDWEPGDPIQFSRIRTDGSVAFALTLEVGDVRIPSTGGSPIELADGTWMLLHGGGIGAPTLTIMNDSGVMLDQYTFDRAVIGESMIPNAWLLTPDGTLYVATSSGLSDAHHIVAIEVGVGQRMPFVNTGLNWARTNATWHLNDEEPSTP